MKKCINNILLLLMLISISAVSCSKRNFPTTTYTPTVPVYEKLDVEDILNAESFNTGDIKVDNKSSRITYSNGTVYTSLNYKKINFKQWESINIGGENWGKEGRYFEKTELFKKSSIGVIKLFFSNGNMKSYQDAYFEWNGEWHWLNPDLTHSPHFNFYGYFPIGISYEYDIEGNLVKTINHEELYKFTLDDVNEYVKKRYKDFPYISRQVFNKSGNREQPTWIIRFYPKKWFGILEIQLDGNADKAVYDSIMLYPYNRRKELTTRYIDEKNGHSLERLNVNTIVGIKSSANKRRIITNQVSFLDYEKGVRNIRYKNINRKTKDIVTVDGSERWGYVKNEISFKNATHTETKYSGNGVIKSYLKRYVGHDNVKNTDVIREQFEHTIRSHWSGFRIGNYYEYYEAGKIVKQINYDEGYDFTLKDVQRYIKKEWGLSPSDIHLEKDSNNGRKIWHLEFTLPGDKKNKQKIELDGNTGELLSKVKEPQ